MSRQLSAMLLFVVIFPASADISGRIVRVLDGDTVEVGLRLGNGKYCTLRLFFVLADINRPQRSILPFCQFFIVSPDIISRQINVLPAQRRQV